MKRLILLILMLLVAVFAQGCVITDWIGSSKSTVMIAPFLSQYEASQADLDYLKIELAALTEQMSDKDRRTVQKSYNTLESLIETAKLKQRGGVLSQAEAEILWFMMQENYDQMVEIFDYYEKQMSPPLRVVYNSTKRSAAAASTEFDTLLQLAGGGKLDVGDLDTLLAKAGSSLLPIILSAL